MTTVLTTLAAAAPAVPVQTFSNDALVPCAHQVHQSHQVPGAPDGPCSPVVAQEAQLDVVFELCDESWDCECCGGIYDVSLDLHINGTSVQSWYEDGHFGDSCIEWENVIALALAYAGARLTVVPAHESPLTTTAEPWTVPESIPGARPLPPAIHQVVWWKRSQTSPEGYELERTDVQVNGQWVVQWREEDHYDDRLDDQGPVRCSLQALGATVGLLETETPLLEEDDVWDENEDGEGDGVGG